MQSIYEKKTLWMDGYSYVTHASKHPCTLESILRLSLPDHSSSASTTNTRPHTHGLIMVYYIRLLKPPRIFTGKRRKATVKFVITVTTDLGDNFFPDDIELSSCLIDSQYRIKGLGESTKSQWRNGMRSVDVQIDIVNHPDIKWPIRLYILAKGVKESLGLSPDDIPTIIGATSDDIDLGDNREARRRVARIFPTDGPILSIWEETGESIARHIW